jgi:hypothetical protein
VIGPALAVLLSLALSPAAIQAPRGTGCVEWHDCREQALAAADRGEYEAFHDLAWRAVQTGPARDPALMYLLARAQALSGRPHDALVMLDRLAQMGVASDAASNEDFSRTRQLPGWPDVAARIERVTHPATAASSPLPSAPAAAKRSAPVPPTPVPPTRPGAFAPLPVVEAVRFSTDRFSPSGLAYDTVSRRFLFGDRLGRKLIVVSEGANHADDLVRSDSAGFQEVSAMEVDAKRGDLWVASSAAGGGKAALHKLQLVSGRPLKAFPVAADLEPAALVDLAVTPSGAVLVLDSMSRRVFVLRSGDGSLKPSVRIDADAPASLTTGGDDGIAYVAHAAGVSRIDLRARTASAVTAAKGVSLARLERIRWYRNALIAVDVDADGSRRILRLDLKADGRAITRATTLEALAAPTAETFVTISGDELLYLTAGARESAAEVVTYRVRLR